MGWDRVLCPEGFFADLQEPRLQGEVTAGCPGAELCPSIPASYLSLCPPCRFLLLPLSSCLLLSLLVNLLLVSLRSLRHESGLCVHVCV